MVGGILAVLVLIQSAIRLIRILSYEAFNACLSCIDKSRCFYDVWLCDKIPQQSLTVTRMHVVKRRILQYAHSHNQLPLDLSILPEILGYDNSIQDGWHRNLIYEVDQRAL